MPYRLAADAVLLLHLGFIGFVLFGGLLVAWRRAAAWVHLPAAAWGAYVELSGRGCPLTALENLWRAQAGLAGYGGGFVEHYLLPLLYPLGLTRPIQHGLAAVVVGVNLLVYGWVVWRWRRRRAHA